MHNIFTIQLQLLLIINTYYFVFIQYSPTRRRLSQHLIQEGMSLSTLLTKKTCLPSTDAYDVPETQSTTTRAPSVTRRAAVTSEEKSTWPGESIKLTRKPLSPFSCWSGWVIRSWVAWSSLKYMEIALRGGRGCLETTTLHSKQRHNIAH